MRIAAISNSRIPSTTANSIQAMKMCDALVQTGNEVRLLVPAEAAPTTWEKLSSHYGVDHEFTIAWLRSRPGLRRLDFVWSARQQAHKHGADLIYTWLPQSAALAAWQRESVVLEMHADVAGLLGAWWLRQFWRSDRGKLLVTTSALRAALERSTGMEFPKERVQVAPNGVDLDRFEGLPDPAKARRDLGLPDALTIGFTGHFYSGRGIELLFELAKNMQDLHFLWVGGTPEAVITWDDRLRAAGLSNVHLTGFVDNSRLPMYQAACDILLMPYTNAVASSSGQDIAEVINPMKMFEYMAAGRPIITADLPVIREVLDETRAIFCPPGDVRAWTAAVQQVVANPQRGVMLADNARREVAKHTWVERARRAIQGLGQA